MQMNWDLHCPPLQKLSVYVPAIITLFRLNSFSQLDAERPSVALSDWWITKNLHPLHYNKRPDCDTEKS